MNLSPFYSIPPFLFFVLVIAVFAGVSIGGFLITRKFVEKWLGAPPAQNEVISYYIAATGVVYGITLGLIAVGLWEHYMGITKTVEDEASTLSELYRNVRGYREPYKTKLTGELKKYTQYIIDEAWPKMERGIVPLEGVKMMTVFQATLYEFEPQTEGQKIIHNAGLTSYNKYVHIRQQRLELVNKGVPYMIWWIVFFGALINLMLSWLFVVKNKSLHILMNGLLGALIGALVFMIIVLDFPFRGWFRVSAEPFEMVYQLLMN